MSRRALHHPAFSLAASLLLVVAAWWLWQATALGPDSLNTSSLVAIGTASSADQTPTAVVLGDFSASIQGPSSALWSLSIALIIIGALIVQYRYRHY